MSAGLREQLKQQYNASQQAAIASVVSPGEALFTLIQVSMSIRDQLSLSVCVTARPCADLYQIRLAFQVKPICLKAPDKTHVR